MVTIEHQHAASNQRRSRSGVMSKYMTESENVGYRTDRNALRSVHGQGVDNATRSRGCMQQVIDPTRCLDYASPRPPSRVPSDAARTNQDRDRVGHMAAVMDRSPTKACDAAATDRSVAAGCDTSRARGVKGDSARHNAARGHDGSMHAVMHSNGTPPTPRAAAISSRCSSRPASSLDGILGGRSVPVDPLPNQRVKPEAADNYSRSRGGAMNALMHAERGERTPPMSRVRPEAEVSAARGRQSRIFGGGGGGDGGGNITPDVVAHARIKPEAAAIAKRNRGTMDKLMV